MLFDILLLLAGRFLVLGLFITICEFHLVTNLSYPLNPILIEAMHMLLTVLHNMPSIGMGTQKIFMTSFSFTGSGPLIGTRAPDCVRTCTGLRVRKYCTEPVPYSI
jgi:hypothetical protein